MFSPLVDKGYSQKRKRNAERKRVDPLNLFKMLVLQQLFNLGVGMAFRVQLKILSSRLIAVRPLRNLPGLGMMNNIPDATTVVLFRERPRKVGVFEKLFEMFETNLQSQGFQARGGQIINATLVPVP